MKSKSTKPKTKVIPPSVATGQLWQMADSSIHVTMVGRTLVHFKHIKPGVVRTPVSLIKKTELEQFLSKNKAVLAQTEPPPSISQTPAVG